MLPLYLTTRSACAFVCLILVTLSAYAQREATQWLFGKRAGATFDGCSPLTFTVGEHFANEGMATIANAAGELQFYTNGLTFWDNQHQIMPGGELPPHWTLEGSYDYTTTTQAALIVPQPGATDRYWTFMTSPRAGDLSDGRFCYYTIGRGPGPDRRLQVESGPVCLTDSLTERLTGVKHSNGQDFWVITQAYRPAANTAQQSGDLLAYRVTAGGVATTPVISPTGRTFRRVAAAENNTGYLKASPDGARVAYVYWEANAAKTVFDNVIGVFDFDAATGRASNPTFADLRREGESFYGLEFSPDGSKLYVSSERNLLQYDLNRPDWPAHGQILYRFGNTLPTIFGRKSLQLAPDGRIYFTNNGHLGCVLNPNLAGSRAGAVPYFDIIRGSGSAQVGLPNFVQSYLKDPLRLACPPRLHAFGGCDRDSSYVSLLVDDPQAVAEIRWSGPPASVDRGFVFTVPSSQDEAFTVEATVVYTNGQDTTLRVRINEDIAYRLPADTSLCAGDTLWITPPLTAYRWGYESLPPEQVENEAGLIAITETGYYSMSWGEGRCARADYLNVNVAEPPLPLNLGGDQTVCRRIQSNVLLSVENYDYSGLVDYQWSDGSTDVWLEARESGTYWLRAENACGVRTDTVRIVFEGDLAPNIGERKALCAGETLTLDPGLEEGTIRWSTGSTDRTLTVSDPGTYRVSVRNSCGEYSDEVSVEAYRDVPLVLPDTTWSCANEPAILNAGAHYETYRWSTGASDSTVQVTQSGYYEVTVSSRCGEQRAGTWVVRSAPEEGFVPNIITPNGDGHNDTFVLDEYLRGSALRVYNRWGKLVYAHPRYQNAWDGDGLPGGVYFYTIDHPCLGEPQRGNVTIQRTR